jgi:hypothetical protein
MLPNMALPGKFAPLARSWWHPHSVESAAGHSEDLDGRLFLPVPGNRQEQDKRRHLHPEKSANFLAHY